MCDMIIKAHLASKNPERFRNQITSDQVETFLKRYPDQSTMLEKVSEMLEQRIPEESIVRSVDSGIIVPGQKLD